MLARIRAFLPQMESSNKDLLQRAKDNPGEVDIENTSGQGQVIEMVSLSLTSAGMLMEDFVNITANEVGFGIRGI